MRIFGFIIMFSLIVAGYAAAANACGMMPNCPHKKEALHDCDHGKGKPAPLQCVKGDCCAVMAPVIPASPLALAASPAAMPEEAAVHIVLTDFIYPQLRPPNSFA